MQYLINGTTYEVVTLESFNTKPAVVTRDGVFVKMFRCQNDACDYIRNLG